MPIDHRAGLAVLINILDAMRPAEFRAGTKNTGRRNFVLTVLNSCRSDIRRLRLHGGGTY